MLVTAFRAIYYFVLSFAHFDRYETHRPQPCLKPITGDFNVGFCDINRSFILDCYCKRAERDHNIHFSSNPRKHGIARITNSDTPNVIIIYPEEKRYKLVPLLSTPCGTTGKDYCYDGCHWITY